MKNYFFAFLGFFFSLTGSVSTFFFGRPSFGAIRISSSAVLGYMPVGPWYSVGFMPFVCSCLLTVSGSLFNSLAMKATVIKSLIGFYYRLYFSKSQQIFRIWDNLLNKYLGVLENLLKKSSESGIIYLIKYSECGIIKE